MVIHDAVGAARGDVDALPLRGPVLGEVQRDDWLALKNIVDHRGCMPMHWLYLTRLENDQAGPAEGHVSTVGPLQVVLLMLTRQTKDVP